MSAWKKDELDICRMVGSERSGPVGRKGPDCNQAAPWAIQIKRAPKPSLPYSWLAQARRDAEHDEAQRPWVLVQSWYRPGRPRVFLATCDLFVLASYGTLDDFPHTMRRRTQRPRLGLDEVVGLITAQAQPWLLIQDLSPAVSLATLDYRVLCRLGERAGLFAPQPAEPEQGG